MSIRISTPNMDALGSFTSPGDLSLSHRKGKWTTQEEEYVYALIDEFKRGHLSLEKSTSLRWFLAKMVHCNPKRVSKKFEGTNYNGKQSYQPSECELEPEEANIRQARLRELEVRFERSLVTLKAVEDTKKAGAESQPPSLAKKPQLQRQPSHGVAGLQGPGVRATEALLPGPFGLLRRPTTPLGLGMNSFPSLAARTFDPTLFPGHGGAVDRGGFTVGVLGKNPRISGYALLSASGLLHSGSAHSVDSHGCTTATVNTAGATAQSHAYLWTATPTECQSSLLARLQEICSLRRVPSAHSPAYTTSFAGKAPWCGRCGGSGWK